MTTTTTTTAAAATSKDITGTGRGKKHKARTLSRWEVCDFEENDDDDEKRQERKDGRVRVYMSSEFPPREIQVWVCGCVCVFPPVSCSLFD